MDPATLIIAALIYLATKVGEKAAEDVAGALGPLPRQAITKVIDRLRNDAQAGPVLQAWADNPRNQGCIRDLAGQIRRLRKADTEFRNDLAELRRELNSLSDDVRAELQELAHAIATPQETPSAGGHADAQAESTGSTAGWRVKGDGTSIGSVFQQLHFVRDNLPYGLLAQLRALSDQDIATITAAVDGAADPDFLLDPAYRIAQQADLTLQALQVLQERIDEWIAMR
jgi:hypothetical protein